MRRRQNRFARKPHCRHRRIDQSQAEVHFAVSIIKIDTTCFEAKINRIVGHFLAN